MIKKFVIKKGHHYCRFWFLKFLNFHFNKKFFEWKSIKMSASCCWDAPRDNDDYDKNKICGLGFGFNHHKNSIRIAWVPDFSTETKTIKLYAYVYDEENKKHQSYFITNVKINANNEFNFSAFINIRQINLYYVKITDGAHSKEIKIQNNNKDSKLIFNLNPYVGGNNTAIEDMKFSFERKAYV